MLLLVCALVPGVSPANVKLPNGEYRTTVEDIKVRVPGGYVAVERTWQAENVNKGEYRWYVNPAWADLRFEYDPIDGSVKTVVRADSTFERDANDLFVYDKAFFIARQTDAAGTLTGWRWYDRGGNWIRYAADGKILAYGGRNDVSIAFERNGPNGQISAVKDHVGATVLSLAYTPDGRHVRQIADRTQRKVQYVYTGDALTEVVDVAGEHWLYGYSSGLLTSSTDPENRTTQIVYSGNRVAKIVDPMEGERTWSYDFDRGKRQYTIVEKSPEGRRVERRYDARGALLSEMRGTRLTRSLRRDSANVDIVTDERGLVSRTEYDARRNPIRQVRPDGTFVTATYDARFNRPLDRTDEIGVTSRSGYDTRGNLVSFIEALGTPLERTTTFTYDALGRRETRTVAGETPAENATTRWTYDAYGNVETTTNPENETVSLTYDVAGRVLTRTDARGKVWTTTYDARGLVASRKDPLGHTRTYEYDKVGKIKKATDAAGKETTYDYDANARLTKVTRPDGGVTRYGYDKDGLLTSLTDARNVARTFVYDAEGRQTQSIEANGDTIATDYGAPGTEAAGLVVRRRYPTYCVEYRYDQRGRQTQLVRRSSCDAAAEWTETSSTAYDAKGRTTSRTNPRGFATFTTYDELGRATATTDALGAVTGYAYDRRNNRTRVKDANGGVHVFTFDRADRVVGYAQPSGASTAYAYDDAGNLVSRADASGRRSAYVYDDAGRRAIERYFEAGSNTADETVAYDYDARDLLTGYEQTGGTESRAVYAYDESGRRTLETITYGSGPGAVTRSVGTDRWPNDLVRSVTYPDGTTTQFAYDAVNRLESASLPGAGELRWDDFLWRMPRRLQMPGGVATLEYDDMQRVARDRVQAIGGGTAQAPAGDVVVDHRYDYDAVGNVVGKTTEDGDYGYGYDALDRLTAATPPASVLAPEVVDGLPLERYTYDGLHNRKSSERQPGTWTYDADNRLVSYGTGDARWRFESDADGRQVKAVRGDPALETLEFVYGATGRLGEVRRDGAVVGRYRYDPFGRRIRKETAAGVVWFMYADDRLVAELSAAGTATRLYGWRPNDGWRVEPLWLADKAGGEWHTYVYRNDPVGAPQRVVDGQGAVVWASFAEAFGKTRARPGATIVNPLRLPGQYEDPETGLHQNFHRDYDPSTGRYVERDPLGLDAGTATFAYAAANPLTLADPLGLWELHPRPPGPMPRDGDGQPLCRDGGFEIELEEGLDPCIVGCALVHESRHIADVRATDPTLCLRVPVGGTYIIAGSPEEKKWTELNAHNDELACYKAMQFVDSICYGDYCTEMIKVEIKWVEHEIEQLKAM